MMRYGSEAQEQQTVVSYCRVNKIPLFAIPNGGKRDAKEAYFLKLSGVEAGVPDLFIPVQKGGFGGLFIEMKVGKNKPTEKQKQWIQCLQNGGYRVEVCYGFDEAKKVIDEYIGEHKKE